jgi:hypothetical protein
MALRLGSGLVRGALAPLPASTSARPVLTDHGRLAGQYESTLGDIDRAADAVMKALRSGPAVRTGPAQSSHPAPPPEPVEHPGGDAEAAPRESVEHRPLSIATVPALIDHTFYRQPDDGATLNERYPVVPMTMMLGMFVEAAERLAPGRVAIAITNVRALRWLAVEPPVEARIEARFDGDDRVRVSIDGYSRGIVTLADGYPDAPSADVEPLRDETEPPHKAEEFYRDRWMFHGPAYQAVTQLHALGSDGIRGSLQSLPAPGALLDAAGQLLGYWIMLHTEVDRIALPTRIERIDLYGPHPEPGTILECTVRNTEITDVEAKGDLELAHEGRVWASVSQFTDRRFECTPELFALMRVPEQSIIAERTDDGWEVREHWRSTATRELVLRRYANEGERRQYEQLTPKDQRIWLLGRIAIKDAVRDWLWQRGAGPIYPIEVVVDDGPDGRPRITCGHAPNLNVELELGDLIASVRVEETTHA